MAKILHWYDDRAKKKKKKKQNMISKNIFFKLMSNSVFEKGMEKVRKHRDIKYVTTEGRMIFLVLEANYHTTIFFQKIN